MWIYPVIVTRVIYIIIEKYPAGIHGNFIWAYDTCQME